MAGTDAAFDLFYARYHRRVRAFAYSLRPRDGDDVAQEAMLRAWASYATLDASRDPWPWLSAIVRNVARDRAARTDAVPLADVPVVTSDATGRIVERELLTAALGRLSSSDRAMLVLRECQEWTFDELSELLGRSPNTLRQQAYRARRRLAHAYTALGGRAGAVVWWLRRWRPPAAADVAAAVVAGAFLAAGPVPPPADARPAPATAGPEARGGTPAGPATPRAAPARPLQPARAARLVPPRPEARQVTVAARPPDGDRVGPASGDPVGHNGRGFGHRAATAPPESEPPICSLTALC